ncbi:hypothetical protein Y1Q_0023871 [Alligator mississippiensis]|uniref:Uncharacterized protein n=1 Tax=Alligator mississippiensis TaxID=8496 RepID=A0A151MKY2_ALLMI|nr:hypothetical protein Y1Q_0023871 [Alligator mississippiensis]
MIPLGGSLSENNAAQFPNRLRRLLQAPTINVDHVVPVWTAPHQALRCVSEDRIVLCSRKQEAGGPGPYPLIKAAETDALRSPDVLSKSRGSSADSEDQEKIKY